MLGGIKAEVIDIRVDAPRSTDTFVVDTNVWYWVNYNKTSIGSVPYQVHEYPQYIKKVCQAKAQLFHSPLSLAELAHIIEESERDILQRQAPAQIDKKFFRHDPVHRETVTDEIDVAWTSTKAISASIDCALDSATSQATLERIKLYPLDGYDALLLAAMRLHDTTSLISDDRDFLYVDRLQVYTANDNAVNAAAIQRRLVKR